MRFTERLVKHAAEARGTMLQIVDGRTTAMRTDGYVLLRPDEAVQLSELLESARAVVRYHYYGGGDQESTLMEDFKAKLDALEAEPPCTCQFQGTPERTPCPRHG